MGSGNYNQLRVLIVDDFYSFRVALSKMLSEFGFGHIDSAANANEALKYCKQHHYDLVLCDYNLGAGKNGQQLLEQLRQHELLRLQDIFILLSAEASRNVVMSANDYEPDAYLTKPITNKMIEQRLRRLLNRRDELLAIFILLQQGDNTKAITSLKEKISQNSRYSMDCQKRLAELYVELSEYTKAEAIYRSVLEMRPLQWAQVGMAEVRLCRGDANIAAKWLRDIIQANPNNMSAYDVLAQALTALEDSEQKQKVLQQAVDISPLSLARQARLAITALENGDAIASAKAYKKLMKYGGGTHHSTPEVCINYGRAVIQCFDKDINEAEAHSKDVFPILDTLKETYELDKQDSLFANMVKAQLLAIKGNAVQANDVIDESAPLITEANLSDVDIEIELVKTYKSNHRFDDANRLLNRMVVHYCDDQIALEKIDPLLPEPVSKSGNKLLVKVIKKGIKAYQEGDFLQAIDCFTKAEKRFPHYIGVKLNLAQALIAKIKSNDHDEGDVGRCEAIFDVVKRNSLHDESQNKRLLQLQEMLRMVLVSQ